MRTPLTSRAGTAGVALLILAIGATCAILFTQKERSRELARWTDTLNVTADAGTQDVNAWVNNQLNELVTLSNNASLPIYFMQAKADAKPNAQGDYLRNQLTATAQRIGVSQIAPTVAQQVGANVATTEVSGIALVDGQLSTVMTSASMAPLSDDIITALKGAPKATPAVIDIPAAGNTPRVAFIAPIYAMMAEHTAANQIGSVVSIRTLDAPFFAMLQPKTTSASLEMALVKKQDGQLRYITNEGTEAPTEQDDAAFASAYAQAMPNSFAEKTDYNGNEVYVTGRAIPNTPWTLIAKVDKHEVFAASAAWRTSIAAIVLLLAAAMAATVVAISRHGSAKLSSEMAKERETRVGTLNQLVATLVSLVDARDPNAAQHSNYTAMVAAATAQQMGLDEKTIETTETAARLLNLGKINVPRELLTRKDLNENERLSIRSSLTKSADIVEGIAFEGPVAQTLRQANEHVNGSGPLKLKGDSILISARIVAAANALIGMVSPRAWRNSMSIEEALQVMRSEIGSHFDASVILAMSSYIENGGNIDLAPLQRPQQQAEQRSA